MHPSIRHITLVISFAATISGCNTLGVLARTEPGAGHEAATVFGKWVHAGGDAAVAATWSRKVAPGVSIQEIEEAFTSVAAEDNLRPVGELFLSNELALRSGRAQRFLKVYSYCDPDTARAIVDFSPAMAAFLPCRISVVEQHDGLWIYAMNMDILIKLGRPMPPDLRTRVTQVRATMLKMLDRAANGEF
ncbi:MULTISPECIES: DUF302 domain-containing protein [Massilia]|jgi:hypothetical protein|uniref:DUF302 domain-containing protein n=1 Tax=Massilia TaxID=149698 RepID=UPI000412C4A4|nr:MULTISPECIES: DUF302 domain-containing protein [Massilia]MDN4038945.1 DUF302 domain-containing protein [Massilia sp. YIM B02443]